MTFILVDLDYFKRINDGSGHGEGDNVLLVTTSALKSSFPDCPVVRWGGDEFVVVVPKSKEELAGDDNVGEFGKKLAEWTGNQCSHAITASIGIGVQDADGSVDRALKRADDALYEAKDAGKNTFRRYAGDAL